MFKKISLILCAAALTACSSTRDVNTTTGQDGLNNGSGQHSTTSHGNGNVQNIDPNSMAYFTNKIGDRVFFGYDEYVLNSDAQALLANQVAWIKKYSPNKAITVEGHCDERGTREYNIALGARRAAMIRRFMVSNGIPSNQIKTISYGKERPAVEGSNARSWAENRRGVVTFR